MYKFISRIIYHPLPVSRTEALAWGAPYGPNIRFTADGGTPPYIHGLSPLALDTDDILLDGDYGDYEVLSEDELNKILN